MDEVWFGASVPSLYLRRGKKNPRRIDSTVCLGHARVSETDRVRRGRLVVREDSPSLLQPRDEDVGKGSNIKKEANGAHLKYENKKGGRSRS